MLKILRISSFYLFFLVFLMLFVLRISCQIILPVCSFWLIFMFCGRQKAIFILLRVVILSSQHRLLKRLFFLALKEYSVVANHLL